MLADVERLKHERNSFVNGHEKATGVRMGEGEFAGSADLLLKNRNDAAVGAKYISEANCQATYATGAHGEDQFADALGGSHDAGGSNRFVCRDENEGLTTVSLSSLEKIGRASCRERV